MAARNQACGSPRAFETTSERHEMKTRSTALHLACATFGIALLTSAGAATASAADDYGSDDVDVTVNIAGIDTPGVLALSVAGTSTTLTENGSTELVRQFTGTLPTVTVTDTRTPEEIPPGAAWYVLGSATDFIGDAGQPAISAANLGWAPAVVGNDGDGLVFAGEEVGSAVDGGPGLVDTELLVSTIDSGAIPSETAWSANAGLTLRADASVAPGNYAATLTLSLFE